MNPHTDPFGELDISDQNEPPQRFEVRGLLGRLIAVQCRSREKNLWWEDAHGKLGLGGLAVSDLPLYRCDRLRTVPLEVPLIATEGGKDCDAVWRADMPAVGTMTGAGGTPCAASLETLRDRIVILWPDNDEVGRSHMERPPRSGPPDPRVEGRPLARGSPPSATSGRAVTAGGPSPTSHPTGWA